MNTHTFYVEIEDVDNSREDSFEVTIVDYEPYVPAKLSGPPEDCYPAEGGSAEGGEPVTWCKNDEGKGTQVPWNTFLESYAADRKLSLDDAEEQISAELYEAIEEAARDYDPT